MNIETMNYCNIFLVIYFSITTSTISITYGSMYVDNNRELISNIIIFISFTCFIYISTRSLVFIGKFIEKSYSNLCKNIVYLKDILNMYGDAIDTDDFIRSNIFCKSKKHTKIIPTVFKNAEFLKNNSVEKHKEKKSKKNKNQIVFMNSNGGEFFRIDDGDSKIKNEAIIKAMQEFMGVNPNDIKRRTQNSPNKSINETVITQQNNSADVPITYVTGSVML